MSDYHPLESIHGVDALVEESREHPLAIFKHSTSCPVSSLAKARVDKALRQEEITFPVYFLDLLRHRNVSNYVAEVFGVRHESPQLLVIDDGEAAYHASHLAIDPAAIHIS